MTKFIKDLKDLKLTEYTELMDFLKFLINNNAYSIEFKQLIEIEGDYNDSINISLIFKGDNMIDLSCIEAYNDTKTVKGRVLRKDEYCINMFLKIEDLDKHTLAIINCNKSLKALKKYNL